MISLAAHAYGVILPVRAQPGARKNAVVGEHNGALKVAVTAAPEKGKANKALVKLLAESLGLSKSHIELVSGETSQDKRFLIRAVDAATLAERIGRALDV
jgi:hypothetical protein